MVNVPDAAPPYIRSKTRSKDGTRLGQKRDPRTGQFLVTHGVYSRATEELLRTERREAILQHRAAVVADLGGPGLSTITTDLVERYTAVKAIGDILANDLVTNGAVSGKGRTRAATTVFLQVLTQQCRLAAVLGLGRKARRVPSASELIQQAGRS